MSQYVDDLYFSLLFDADETFPVSDSRYAEELQLQEAIMSSLSPVIAQNRHQSPPITNGSSRINLPVRVPSTNQNSHVSPGESSSSSFCNICMETKPWTEMFRNNTCTHLFCSDCVSKHIAAKVQENISSVPCPDVSCRVALEPDFCRELVPEALFQRWADALCESMVLASQKFYCPYKDCGTLMVDDAGETVRESECPSCRRLFCAYCEVPWHSGLLCRDFKKLDRNEREKEDLMVMELAKRQNWKRCPSCKFFVEKTEGCLHMTCRCRYEFCYRCGSAWGTCANYSCSGRN
ncbi:hypothetical protein H6P81_002109 [Aristolochia fimbriata]|uniref:RBR-type E3 ubiquitin transferase n=1 Tax=Aristolochia fimbriata TaxID=158543 RepID=A0AAV7FC44_ARIFI|nr:hypothetical protein H6P81_002109 [Aristolochia fimbriata]